MATKTVEIPYEEIRAAVESESMQQLVDRYAGFSADIVSTLNLPGSKICYVKVIPKPNGN